MKGQFSKQRMGVYTGVALAFVLWYITFVLQPFNFWLMMSISTSLLTLLSFAFGKSLFRKREWNWRAISIGVLSACTLYGIFWFGNQMTLLASKWMPELLPHRSENLASIYANRGSLPPLLVGALLFFPIGFGEELFWRGFVQRYFVGQLGSRSALIFATLLYTMVHLDLWSFLGRTLLGDREHRTRSHLSCFVGSFHLCHLADQVIPNSISCPIAPFHSNWHQNECTCGRSKVIGI
jgi:membrane protease YdiL (CAAX protease family)